MTTPRDGKPQKSPLLPLLAALAAAAAAIALFLLTRSPAPAPAPKPAPASPAELEALPTPIPSPSSAPESTPEPSPSPSPSSPSSPAAALSPEFTESEAAPEESSDSPPAPHEINRPSEEELLGPLPSQEKDEVVASIPTLHEPIPFNVPAPPRVEVASIAEQPSRWPSRVLLRKTVRFPVMINGQAAGSVLVPARTVVAVRRVYPDGRLEIGYHQSTMIVPSASTDFLLRVKGAPGATGAGSGASPAAVQPRKQIVTFPETVLNPSIPPSTTTTPPARNREIPLQ